MAGFSFLTMDRAILVPWRMRDPFGANSAMDRAWRRRSSRSTHPDGAHRGGLSLDRTRDHFRDRRRIRALYHQSGAQDRVHSVRWRYDELWVLKRAGTAAWR